MFVRSAVTAVAVLVGLMAFGTPTAQAVLSLPNYPEVDDAGDLNDPQLITGGPYAGIVGSIGGSDLVDVFGFGWPGGDFEVTASYPGPDTLTLALFDALKNPEGTIVTVPTVLAYPDLEPGSYFLKIATTGSVDPPFTLSLSGPSTASSILAFVPAPPSIALVLLGAGLVGLGARRARRRD